MRLFYLGLTRNAWVGKGWCQKWGQFTLERSKDMLENNWKFNLVIEFHRILRFESIGHMLKVKVMLLSYFMVIQDFSTIYLTRDNTDSSPIVHMNSCNLGMLKKSCIKISNVPKYDNRCPRLISKNDWSKSTVST